MKVEQEIREVWEVDRETGENVLKKYVVHIVKPKTDTLFKLAYQYKVSKRSIQNANKISGDDIFFLKELLVPFNGTLLDPSQAKVLSEEEKEKEEKSRRATCVQMLSGAISVHERKYMQQGKIAKHKASDFKSEAKYYLENTNYDYWAALKEYQQDLDAEAEMFTQEKLMRKSGKGKRIAAGDFPLENDLNAN